MSDGRGHDKVSVAVRPAVGADAAVEHGMIEVVRTSFMTEKRRVEQRRGNIVVALVQCWGYLPAGWVPNGTVGHRKHWMTTVEISDDNGAFCIAARRADHRPEAVIHWDQLLEEHGLRSVLNDNDTGAAGVDYLTETE